MKQLPLFFDLAGRAVLLVGDGPAADAKARLIEEAGGRIVREIGEARLAFVAVDVPEAEAARLKAAGLLVNVVDRPDLCDFTVPAIVNRAPVTVAIGTGGASATLAKALRERLEALLPDRLGRLAQAIAAARGAVAERHPEAADRRRFWDALLSVGGALDPFADIADPAAAILGGALPAEPALRTIAARSPDDLTLAELRALSTADTVFHTAKASQAVLSRVRRDAVRVVATSVPAPLPPGRNVFVTES